MLTMLLILATPHAATLPPCAQVTTTPPLCARRLAPTIDLVQPVWVGEAAGQRYVAERGGRLLRIDAEGAKVVADLADRVLSRGQEEGLLGVAFHPNFPTDPRIFLYHSAASPRRGRLVEYHLTGGLLDPASERLLLEVRQPYPNHNGGALLFGPDGHLYLSLGDGGAAADPHGNGQNTGTRLGSILRLDIHGLPYAIPADNPFADGGIGKPEVWAWGLRNVWRMSFDPVTGVLWGGDVGQNAWEEIDVLEGGRNYGWDIREGDACFRGKTCETPGLTAPVHVYGREKGVSVTGGPVYRGAALPSLVGAPIFGDFGSGTVWALCQQGDTAQAHPISSSGLHPAHFGVDAQGEIVVVHLVGPPTGKAGGLFELTPDCP